MHQAWSLGQFAGGHVIAAVPEIGGDLRNSRRYPRCGLPGVRQQRGEIGPGLRLSGVVGDRGLDQGGSSLPPLLGQLRGHLIGGDGLHQPVHRH